MFQDVPEHGADFPVPERFSPAFVHFSEDRLCNVSTKLTRAYSARVGFQFANCVQKIQKILQGLNAGWRTPVLGMRQDTQAINVTM